MCDEASRSESADQVLGVTVPNPQAPDRCLRQLTALPVARADGGHPPAVRRPARPAPLLPAAPRGELPNPLRARVDEVDVGAPAEVGIRMAVRREGDLAAVGRPLRVVVVVPAGRERLGLASRRVDGPEPGEALVDEPGAVELVAQRVDQARVRRRWIVGLALRLALGLGGVGAADDDEPAAIGRPVEPLDILRQVCQLSRLTAIGEGKQPDLGATLLGGLSLARLRAATTGLEDRGAIRGEGERAPVGRPARRRVALRPGRQLARRRRSVGRHDPDGGAIPVLPGATALTVKAANLPSGDSRTSVGTRS